MKFQLLKDKRFKKFILTVIGIGICILVAFIIANSILSTNEKQWLDAVGWTTIVIGILTAGTTATLGYITVWQNKMQREDNLRTQREMEERWQAERKAAFEQTKFNYIIADMENYRAKLQDLDKEIHKINFLNYVISFSENLEKLEKDEKEKTIIENKIRNIAFLAARINITTYFSAFYIEDLNNLNKAFFELDNALKNLNEIITNKSNIEKVQLNLQTVKNKAALFYNNWQYYITKFDDYILARKQEKTYEELIYSLKANQEKQNELRNQKNNYML